MPRSRDWTAPIRRFARLPRLKPLPARQRVLMWVGGFAGAFAIGYVVAALVLFPAPIFASATGVPNLFGLMEDEAADALEQAGLALGDVEEATHPVAARRQVVWQDPPPGVRVTPRAAVSITVSTGPQRVPVPDLVGYDAALAGQLLTAAGLTIRSLDSTQAPVPRGVVVNTRPPAGAPLVPGTGVTLVVSVGAPTIVVPDLAGLTRAEAEFALADVGLILGAMVRRTSMADEPGTIIEQRPAPGTLSAPGTAVNVTVAR